MNIINDVISFTGVVRATMDIFSSDASWIVETEGDTEKTDPAHSTGRSCFTIIKIVMKNHHHFRFKYIVADFVNSPFHPIVAVPRQSIFDTRMFCQVFFHLPTRAAPPYKPNIMPSHNRHPLSFHMSVPP